MKKKLSRSFKTKLLIIFILISAIPLTLALFLNAMNMISESKKHISEDGVLRNRLALDKITELYDKNLTILRILADNPITKHFLLNPDGDNGFGESNRVVMERLMLNSNKILDDDNNMIITDTQAQQLIRTDGYDPVNVLQRWYFWESMSGREAISEVIKSLATGRLISVVEVPVIGDDGHSIGLVQRDYDLGGLQQFVSTLASENTQVLILDREGKILAHSSHPIISQEDRTDESEFEFVQRALNGESGYTRTIIDGEDSYVTYSRNSSTGWVVITIQPSEYIIEKIYGGAIFSGACGIALLILISVVAYFLADKIAKPIVALNRVVHKVANHDQSAFNELVAEGDELDQMATAVEKIQSSANALREESETDQLTHLLNKITMEKICRRNLRSADLENPMVLFVIDLDHFKEANDTHGHQYGDKILQEFATRLKKNFRATDYVGRFGGDEFVVLTPQMPNREIAMKKASQILKIARELKIEGKSANISASIGFAIATRDGIDYETLFNAADKSLYQVKRKGRNGYCFDREEVFHE